MSDQVAPWHLPEPVPIAPTAETMVIAFHEASHSCAYFHYGWRLYVEICGPDSEFQGALTPAPGVLKDPVSFAVSCLAGPVGECRYSGADWCELTQTSFSDFKMAREALARLPNPPSLGEIAAKADAILQTKWKLVERVAFELVERRMLTDTEFIKCLTRW